MLSRGDVIKLNLEENPLVRRYSRFCPLRYIPGSTLQRHLVFMPYPAGFCAAPITLFTFDLSSVTS